MCVVVIYVCTLKHKALNTKTQHSSPRWTCKRSLMIVVIIMTLPAHLDCIRKCR